MKKVVVLGSTGSIGVQALEVIQAAGDELQLVGISAHSNWEDACRQAEQHDVPAVAIADPAAAERCARERPGTLAGEEGVMELVASSGADLVLNAITGSAGLGPTIVALTEGIELALANKESLVVGGELVTTLAEATSTAIIPVDSEHSALYQLIRSEPAPGSVERLVLTASGGPFREREDLSGVTVAEALKHPTWEMGGRITIDSATLLNKGLELIEAHHLFAVPYERIDVVVHPQSIVHSLVHLNDGATLAHLGYPDMRVPISYALHHPQRADVALPALDLTQVSELTFAEPDLERFPCLRLAREAGTEGGTAPCVLNAADEVAVKAFLDGRIPFTAIPDVVARTLDRMPTVEPTHFHDLYAVDHEARVRAAELVQDVA
ncbi:MAG: 1-deoxy-D-xylulose-5-phosphate reductoisomerase [Actinomycetota bacterium]|nr:1-deoxy-D-xylulose-5-phosphate reductoisomerase [Actinomycetota bacterium]